MNSIAAQAQNYRFEKAYYYHFGQTDIDETYRDNSQTTDSILMVVRDLRNAGAQNIQIQMTSHTSPDVTGNEAVDIAYNRNQNVIKFLSVFNLIDVTTLTSGTNGYDWDCLLDQICRSNNPDKAELTNVIRNIPDDPFGANENTRIELLRTVGSEGSFQQLVGDYFQNMRNTTVSITAYMPLTMQPTQLLAATNTAAKVMAPTVEHVGRVPKKKENAVPRMFRMGVSSNLLYDVAAIPNLGVDFYFARHFSVGINYMYADWTVYKDFNMWHGNGGDLHFDYWFNGKRAFSGHHVGVIGQAMKWKWRKNDNTPASVPSDGAQPYTAYKSKNYNFAAGITYGYALPITKDLTLDFGIGVGYFRMEYRYDKFSDNYNDNGEQINIKSGNRGRSWIGPTKAEVKLIWKIGTDR